MFRLLCMFGHHRRGGSVRHAGRFYRSTCRGCQCSIRRRSNGGRWQADDHPTREKALMVPLGSASALSMGLAPLD